jgi:hypothetical protein
MIVTGMPVSTIMIKTQIFRQDLRQEQQRPTTGHDGLGSQNLSSPSQMMERDTAIKHERVQTSRVFLQPAVYV